MLAQSWGQISGQQVMAMNERHKIPGTDFFKTHFESCWWEVCAEPGPFCRKGFLNCRKANRERDVARRTTKSGVVISGNIILMWKLIWSQVAAGLRSPFRQKGPTEIAEYSLPAIAFPIRRAGRSRRQTRRSHWRFDPRIGPVSLSSER